MMTKRLIFAALAIITVGATLESLDATESDQLNTALSLTIPEGLTSEQVISCMTADSAPVGEDIPGLNREQEAKCRESAAALTGDAPAPPTEGSILPETYAFSRGDTRTNVLNRMLRERDRILTEVWNRRAPDLPLSTIDELIVLASVVEKETGLADERSRVAAVFINRLRLNMRLQSDPTVVYGMFGGKGKPADYTLSKADLESASPYNTYVNEGLPPGPIANPGRDSLEAVANPSRTRDLFFVADGSGGYAFAETYEDHLRNVARWRQLNAAKSEPVREVAAAETAVLYEEPLKGAPNGVTAINAGVTWRFIPNGPNGPEVEADLTVPERKMKVRLAIHKNADATFSEASHLIEVLVHTPPDFPGNGIKTIPRIVMKLTEESRGEALVGAPAKVSEGFFWIALSADGEDVDSNLGLLRERNWIDLPFVYETGQRAILTFEKGPVGKAAFDRLLNASAQVAAKTSASDEARIAAVEAGAAVAEAQGEGDEAAAKTAAVGKRVALVIGNGNYLSVPS